MTFTYRSKTGSTLTCRFDSNSSGWLNNLRFEDRDGYLYFFKEGVQTFPDPSVCEAIRRFQKMVSEHQLPEAA